jgi:hypothetical protein
MPLKQTGASSDWEEVDRFDGGVGWLAYPNEDMQRASHAIVEDGDVWVLDPVDVPGLDDLLADLGDVAGVLVLLDRHKRDAAAIANRHDVSVHLPRPLHGVADDLDAPVERFRHDLGDTSYAAHTVVDRFFWHEAALYSEEQGVLFVPEAVGTAPYFRVADERLGVHPALRAMPPKGLGRLSPDHLLVGHGAGIHDDATGALTGALERSRRTLPSLYWQTLTGMLGG